MNDVLLINPGLEYHNIFPPLGIMYIDSFLKTNNYNSKILNLDGKIIDKEIVEAFLNPTPKIIGITTLTGPTFLQRAINLSKLIKDIKPEVFVIWGGSHASLFPELSLSTGLIDAVVIGDGEYPIFSLLSVIEKLDTMEPSEIQGLMFKNSKKLPMPSVTYNLDQIPFPSFISPFNQYITKNDGYLGVRSTFMITSRGCAFRCGFCYTNAIKNKTWRARSISNVIEEIKYFVEKHDVKGVYFLDDLFFKDKHRVVDFCNKLTSEKINIKWFCDLRANQCEIEILKIMKSAGCMHIYIGVESGSERILKLLNKGISIDEIKSAFKVTKDLGINTTASIILGFPGETEEDLKKTLDLAEEISATDYDVQLYIPYPNTPIYNLALINGFKKPNKIEEWIRISSWKDSENYTNLSKVDNNTLFDFFHRLNKMTLYYRNHRKC